MNTTLIGLVSIIRETIRNAVFLKSTEAVLSLRDGRSGRAVVRVKPVGASAAARIVADGELPGVVNYAGRAPGAAPIGAPTYERVRYADLYPGVDLVYYAAARASSSTISCSRPARTLARSR